jgi:hypothetical protein
MGGEGTAIATATATAATTTTTMKTAESLLLQRFTSGEMGNARMDHHLSSRPPPLRRTICTAVYGCYTRMALNTNEP